MSETANSPAFLADTSLLLSGVTRAQLAAADGFLSKGGGGGGVVDAVEDALQARRTLVPCCADTEDPFAQVRASNGAVAAR